MGVTSKLLVLVAVPPDVVMDIAPVEVPGITMPTTEVLLPETTIAAVPPIVNDVGLLNPVPVTVTNAPTGPDTG